MTALSSNGRTPDFGSGYPGSNPGGASFGRPTVSVVIPACNAAKTLTRCVQTAEGSTYPLLEIIVVDDGSNDATAVLAEQAGCRVIRLTSRGGPGSARNRGASEARGELIMFLDSDTEVEPATIENAVTRLVQARADAVVGIYSRTPLSRGFFARYYGLLKYTSHARRVCDDYNVFASQCALIRREAFQAVGGFSPLPPGVDVENEELGRRLAARGRMVLDPAVQVRHAFRGFLPMMPVLFRRSAWWTRYFTVHRTFEATLTTLTSAVAACLGPLSVLALVSSMGVARAWLRGSLAAAGLAALAGFIAAHAGFLACCRREAGWAFAAAALVTTLVVTSIVAVGAAWGLLSAPFTRGVLTTARWSSASGVASS